MEYNGNFNIFKSKRYGKIKISPEIYQQFWTTCKLEIIPLRLQFFPHLNIFELECFCEAFRKLDGSELIPEYHISFKKINNHISVDNVLEV